MLNFTQLRTFYQAAKSLNFTVAAQRLFVTQPAVTNQIKLFENFCKLKLFKKKGRQMYLTDEGKTVFRYTSKMFELERDLEQIIEDLRKVKYGFLRIGTTKTYARNLMPLILTPFHKAFPGITIELDEGSSLEMSESLLDFRNSVAVIPRVADNPELYFIPFLREHVLLISAPDGPLVNRGEISFDEITEQPIIMKEVGSGTRKLVEECLGNKKEALRIIAETSNVDFIKEMVKLGEGISFLVKTAVKTELANGELVAVPVQGRSLSFDVCIAYVRNYQLPPAAKCFLDFLLPMISTDEGVPELDTFVARLTRQKGMRLINEAA